MYDSIELLVKSDFNKFEQQLKRAAFMYNWPDYILDVNAVINNDVDPNAHEARHIKNAYMVIMTKCDGHCVENLLEAVEVGDAIAAWRTVYRHFNKDTVAGKSNAATKFYTASMSNTNTNVLGFIALITRRAKILVSAGSQVTEGDKVGRLLAGLLPEFKAVVTILNARPDLTFPIASEVITDFAESNNLTEYVKG